MSTRSRSQGPALAAALCLVLAACGSKDPDAPSRIRLWTLDAAELERVPARSAPKTLLEEDFEEGFDGWRVVSNPQHPLVEDAGAIRAELEVEDGRSFVRLSGRRGGLAQKVEVEPLTCYEFEGDVRSNAIEPAQMPFFGATFWMAELNEAGPMETLLTDEAQQRIEKRQLFPTSSGKSGWQTQRRFFRTGPEARSLLVALMLGTTEDVSSGAVDFASIRLRKVAPEALWGDWLAREIDARAAVQPASGDWRDERLTSANLGTEVRPSIALFPGESLRFRLRLPAGKPRLECGVGPWPPDIAHGWNGAQTFVVQVDGQELARVSRPLVEEATDARWTALEADLAAHAGEEVELSLALEGAGPGVFGAPLVRDATARPAGKNLLLISIDTLRADHVGAYGAQSGATPHLDALAREGILFADASSQAPYTLPSHATIFSGQFPSVHGVFTMGHVLAALRSPLLAETLAVHGFATQAYAAGGFLNALFGFDRGFDGFASSVDPLRDRASGSFDGLIADPRNGVTRELVKEFDRARVERWLAEHADQRFFLFLHTYTVHDYDPPPAYLRCAEEGCTSTRSDLRPFTMHSKQPEEASPADRAHVSHRYDAALRFIDDELGRLLARLAELGLAEDTVVAVTSDHGEEMFDRGYIQHGKTLYEELTRVPLILRVPGMAPRVVREPVMLVDLAPTLLTALGIAPDPRMQGTDLLAERRGAHLVYSEVDDLFARKTALREPGGKKLIHGPLDAAVQSKNTKEWELYDLAADPGELHDLSASEPELLERLQRELEKRREGYREAGALFGAVGEGELDEAVRAQLEALGYLGEEK